MPFSSDPSSKRDEYLSLMLRVWGLSGKNAEMIQAYVQSLPMVLLNDDDVPGKGIIMEGGYRALKLLRHTLDDLITFIDSNGGPVKLGEGGGDGTGPMFR